MEAMPNAPASTALVGPTVQIALMVTTPTDSMDTLLRIVKSIKELGCEPVLGEPNAEIISRWLRTVEDILDQMQVAEGLQVNCVVYLLPNRARS